MELQMWLEKGKYIYSTTSGTSDLLLWMHNKELVTMGLTWLCLCVRAAERLGECKSAVPLARLLRQVALQFRILTG